MMRQILLMAVAAVISLTAQGQTRDPNNKYLVWTNNIMFKEEAPVQEEESKEEVPAEEVEKSFIEKYFHYESLCDWKEGMRFMVIPDKRDMVVRTFCDSTDRMVSSMSLRHKIMTYKGRHAGNGLHERILFQCEDGKSYYFELPTATFEDYCFTKFGVPTLAYLGDVDTAIEQLVGKKLLTKNDIYNVDVSTTSYGYEKIEVPLGTEVTVVAAGVGTRSYPVKLIVVDDSGREFFQNIAISRTNSGMRDEEFKDPDEFKHTFEGSFELLGDGAVTNDEYKKYVGNKVFTLYNTFMDVNGKKEEVPRLTAFTIKAMHVMHGTKYVRMTLDKSGTEYVKLITFQHDNVASSKSDNPDDYYYSLFASGNLGSVKGVKKEHLADIQKSNIRVGFNEAEVRLALGEPNARTKEKNGTYTWIYRSMLGKNDCTIFFNASNKLVKYVKK